MLATFLLLVALLPAASTKVPTYYDDYWTNHRTTPTTTTTRTTVEPSPSPQPDCFSTTLHFPRDVLHGSIYSPGYPGHYRHKLRCNYVIEAARPGWGTILEVVDFYSTDSSSYLSINEHRREGVCTSEVDKLHGYYEWLNGEDSCKPDAIRVPPTWLFTGQVQLNFSTSGYSWYRGFLLHFERIRLPAHHHTTSLDYESVTLAPTTSTLSSINSVLGILLPSALVIGLILYLTKRCTVRGDDGGTCHTKLGHGTTTSLPPHYAVHYHQQPNSNVGGGGEGGTGRVTSNIGTVVEIADSLST